MPLDLSALKSSPGLPGAGGAAYPATRSACAQAWADAMESYAADIVPVSTTVAAAAAALATALDSAFGAGSVSAVAAAMETAFAAFATSVGGGMAGYTPTPPATPVGFAALFAPPYPESRQDGVDAVADAIDAWLTTGTATLVAPPNTVLTWS